MTYFKNSILQLIKLFAFGLLWIVPGLFHPVSAQCGMALKEVVVKEIGNATYLKDFRVKLDEGNIKKPPTQEFTILLNKGTHYRFNIKADSSCTDKPVLKLYDFSKFYGSNYDASDGSTYEYFDFFCAKTQVYSLSISFAEAKSGCAAAIVSFVGNYDAN